MDCSKVGKLILSLRKSKNMTQKQLADIMNISDKTVSKWERGRGCPDISLLTELADILGVNAAKILDGELNENQRDGGNMKKLKFYVCHECGNIITSSSDAEIFCCGKKTEPEIIQKPDDNHNADIKIIENDYYITLNHDMTKQHYISFAAYVDYDKAFIKKLYPEQNPEIRFPVMGGGKLYIYCNKHGLFEFAV